MKDSMITIDIHFYRRVHNNILGWNAETIGHMIDTGSNIPDFRHKTPHVSRYMPYARCQL